MGRRLLWVDIRPESSLECIGCFPRRLLESVGVRSRQASLGLALGRQPANHSGDIVSMSPTRSSDPAFEELVLARAEEGRDH